MRLSLHPGPHSRSRLVPGVSASRRAERIPPSSHGALVTAQHSLAQIPIQPKYKVTDPALKSKKGSGRVDIHKIGSIDELADLFERLPTAKRAQHRSAFRKHMKELRSHGLTSTYDGSYQNQPALFAPKPRQNSRGVTRYTEQVSRGGAVTPNPSPYFPTAAATDEATYNRRGYSRIIGPEDIEGGVHGAITTTTSGLSSIKGFASSVGARATSLLSGGGPSLSEEREVRQRLSSEEDDPRVTHYLRTHTGSGLAKTVGSGLLSFATGGISGLAQGSTEIGGHAALAGELQGVLSGIDEQERNAHSADDRPHPRVREAVAAIQAHYAKQAGKSGIQSLLKAVPFADEAASTLSSLASGTITAESTVSGLPSAVEEAGTTLTRLAGRGDPHALRVINLLGIPHELTQATGGEKVIHKRLS